jgi:hypothetical protein
VRRRHSTAAVALCLALAAAPTVATCGDGLLEAAETCTACSADCATQPCDATIGTQSVALTVKAPGATTLVAVTLQLAYRHGALRLPADALALRKRARAVADGGLVAPKDLGYALRLVVARAGGLLPGPAVEVAFDRCAGSASATTADLSCTVRGCAGAGGQLDNCTCTLAIR